MEIIYYNFMCKAIALYSRLLLKIEELMKENNRLKRELREEKRKKELCDTYN